MDLNSMLAQFTGAAQQRMGEVQSTQQAYDADTAKIQALLTNTEQESAVAVQRAAQIAGQEAQVAHTIGKAKEANAAIAGMNPDDLNNQYVSSLANFDTAEQQRTALEQQRTAEFRRYEQLAGANLLENPLAYIAAQLQLPGVAARHNTLLNQEIEATQRRESAARNVTARTELIRAKDSIIAANTADTLLTINTAKAENAARMAQVELSRATADNISKIGMRALDSMRLGGEMFNLKSDMLNKTMSLEQWKMQREAAAEARAERVEAQKMRMAQAKDQEAEIAAHNERLRAASHALGYVAPVTMKTLKTLSPERQEQLNNLAWTGTLGTDLVSSLATVTNAGDINTITRTNPGMSKFITGASEGLSYYGDQVLAAARTTNTKLSTKDVVLKANDNYTADIVQSAGQFGAAHNLSSSTYDKVFNPYRPNYLALLDSSEGGAIPQLKDNKALAVVSTLRKDLAPGASNIDGKSMERMVQVLAKQVADGSVGLDVAAADLTKLHQIAAIHNRELYNYTAFGLEPQTRAIISVPPVNSFGEPYKLDLLDAASTKKNLARMAAEQRRGTMGAAVDWLAPKALFGIDPGGKLQGMIERERAAAEAKK